MHLYDTLMNINILSIKSIDYEDAQTNKLSAFRNLKNDQYINAS